MWQAKSIYISDYLSIYLYTNVVTCIDVYVLQNSNINNVTTNPPINATDRDKGDGRQDLYYRFDSTYILKDP